VIRVLAVVAIIIAALFFNQPDPVDTGAGLPITTEAPTSSP